MAHTARHSAFLAFSAPNMQTVLVALFVGICYFVVAALGPKVGLPPTRVLWVPNAVLLATLLLVRHDRWWFCLLLILPFLIAAPPASVPLPAILAQSIVNLVEPLVCAAALLAFCPEPRRFERVRSSTVLIVFCAALVPFAASLIESAVLLPSGHVRDFWLSVTTRTLIGAFAVLTLVPLIVQARRWLPHLTHATHARALEAAALASGIVAVCAYALVGPVTPANLFVPLPLLIWAALRFGVPGTCMSVLTLGAVAIWGVLSGKGPFVDPRPLWNALSMLLFVDVMASLLLLLTALFAERREVTRARQTAEREACLQRQKARHLEPTVLLGELCGAVAHELNQPLTSILANAEAGLRLLRNASADAGELREILRDIINEDMQGSELLQRLRALRHPAETPTSEVDLNALIQEALRLLRSDLRARRVAVATSLDPQLPTVLANWVQIEHVLLNLILNGAEPAGASNTARRRLSLATQQLREAHAVEISISDYGDEVSQHASTERRLATSQSIIEAHGGRMWIQGDAAARVIRFTLPAR